MAAIKNVGEGVADRILQEYNENGEYKNYEDFVVRTRKDGLNKKALESLILAGALDSLPGNRKQKFESVDKVLDYANRKLKEDDIQQMNLFGEAILVAFMLPQMAEYTIEELLAKEKEYLGFYFSAHPLDNYRNIIDVYRLNKIADIKEEKSPRIFKTYGIIRDIKKVVTKKTGQVMCLFELEDYYDKISCVVFPRDYAENAHIFVEGKAVYIEGSVQTDYFKGSETKKVIVKNIRFLDELCYDKRFTVYLLITEEDKEKFSRLKQIILSYLGDTKLSFAIKTKTTKEVKSTKYKVLPSKLFIDEIIELIGVDKITIK